MGRKAIAFLREQAPAWLERELTVSQPDGTLKRHFWQPGGGYDRNVVEEWTSTAILEYIHLNPVKRGLVARPEDWEWSSARWYAGLPSRLAIDPTLPRVYET